MLGRTLTDMWLWPSSERITWTPGLQAAWATFLLPQRLCLFQGLLALASIQVLLSSESIWRAVYIPTSWLHHFAVKDYPSSLHHHARKVLTSLLTVAHYGMFLLCPVGSSLIPTPFSFAFPFFFLNKVSLCSSPAWNPDWKCYLTGKNFVSDSKVWTGCHSRALPTRIAQ